MTNDEWDLKQIKRNMTTVKHDLRNEKQWMWDEKGNMRNDETQMWHGACELRNDQCDLEVWNMRTVSWQIIHGTCEIRIVKGWMRNETCHITSEATLDKWGMENAEWKDKWHTRGSGGFGSPPKKSKLLNRGVLYFPVFSYTFNVYKMFACLSVNKSPHNLTNNYQIPI